MYKDQHKGTVPNEIIIYRSDVDEGSYALTISEEIPRVRSFLAVKGAADVKLVFSVAQKEQNVRLFKEEVNPTDKPTQQNVLSGTVVEGSASTPSYSVFVDDLSMTMNELEGITFALAHDLRY